MGLGQDHEQGMAPFIMVRETLSIEAFKFRLGSDIQDFLYLDLELTKIHENGTRKRQWLEK